MTESRSAAGHPAPLGESRTFAERVARLDIKHTVDGSVLLSYDDYRDLLACIREQQAALNDCQEWGMKFAGRAVSTDRTIRQPFIRACQSARAVLAKWEMK